MNSNLYTKFLQDFLKSAPLTDNEYMQGEFSKIMGIQASVEKESVTNKVSSSIAELNGSEPIGYRDNDGKIKMYASGEAPFVWIRDDSGAKHEEPSTKEDNNAEDIDRNSSLSGRTSEIGESYSVHGASEKETYSFTEVVSPVSPAPEVKLPRKRRKDLMPNDRTFLLIDEHAMKAPPLVKEDMQSLVDYLTSGAKTTLEKVRAFFLWITHNVNYDTSGYFGRTPLKPTDPESVLKSRLTVCEGYCNLFEAFCQLADIPVKTICGYAKAYNYQPGDDVTKDAYNAHAWNAIFVDNDWLLLDVTWGAGYVKAKEKKYVAKFNNAYFLTDPEVFLTDHLPHPVKGYETCESGPQWQLVEDWITKEEFAKLLTFDMYGKEWGIKAVTHTKSIIANVRFEIDIVLEATYVAVSDYIAYIYEDERKIDQFSYTQMLTEKRVNIHVTAPAIGVFILQIYGRRKKDGIHADYKPIVKYILQCTETYSSPVPYPSHHTVFGPVDNLSQYGITDVGATYRESPEGELIIVIKPTRLTDIVPKIRFGDHNIDLKEYCFVDYSDCFNFIHVILRLRYEGYYKLELLAQADKSKYYTPFVAYLIKCTKGCTDGVFPYANHYAQKYKCCLLEPLYKHIPPNSEITFCVKSPIVLRVKSNGKLFNRTDEVTFEGKVMTPSEDSKLILEGAAKDGVFRTLYTYNTAIPVERRMESAQSNYGSQHENE